MPQARSFARASAGVVVAGLAIGLATPAHAITNGTGVPNGAYTFTAQVESDFGRCTGALIDPQWIATAASCFAEPGGKPAAGKPAKPAKTIVGRTLLSQANGHVVDITELVPRSDRDLVLAKLAEPVTDVAPVRISGAAPQKGEVLRGNGFGRTATVWAPDQLQTAEFAVDAVTPQTIEILGHSPKEAGMCQGDAGSPAFRDRNGIPELVAINSTSWQRGCLEETETRNGATNVRLDGLADWINTQIVNGRRMPGVAADNIIELRGVQAGKCLEIGGGDKANDAKAINWQCNSGPTQRWELIGQGVNTYLLKNNNSKKCLEVAGGNTSNGVPLVQFDCAGSRSHQRWQVVPSQGGSLVLRNEVTGRAAAVENSATHEGARLVQYAVDHSPGQQWKVQVASTAKHDLVTPETQTRSLRTATPGLFASARHASGLGRIERIDANSPDLDKRDATWKIVPGLADPSCYSFESFNIPGAFLRHANYRIRLDDNDNSATFKADATWCARTGLSAGGVSFESFTFPERRLRHYSGELWLADNSGSRPSDNPQSYSEDVTWVVGEPWTNAR
ncbi:MULTISPECIES: AbfB domain-containing protein [unclassified Crossiella]|uniref:AbfB domain-containing protein n=1 Tax=unclassified Crossiella TaxID=2620835 RepID=UPI001FFE3F5E|nr:MULTISPECIES: AbfB domain-containing protein [unclassified Crossiella]MCK2237432.1 AbfB domain-containing protein [Crossiella sp. S99.2]MCK2251087.1 AbfB domain-containing protein [Crossiella sp. S99.1]